MKVLLKENQARSKEVKARYTGTMIIKMLQKPKMLLILLVTALSW